MSRPDLETAGFTMYGPEFTFLGVPRADLEDPASLQGADVVVVGALDGGARATGPGPGSAPPAIRGTDYLGHDGSRSSLALGVDALQDLRVVDVGDVRMLSGEIVFALDRLERAVHTVAAAGPSRWSWAATTPSPCPTSPGWPATTAWGGVSVVHFDAHADTGDTQFGSLLGHGTPMRRLIESGRPAATASSSWGCAATGRPRTCWPGWPSGACAASR